MGRNYAAIVGQGRSGSNWLLNLFDLSPDTFCRDEPDLLKGSPFRQLRRDQFVRHDQQSLLEEGWDDAVRFTVARMGAHDNPIIAPKAYMYEVSRRLGVYRAVRGYRWRRLWAWFVPSFRDVEWVPPSYLVNARRFERSTAVLKFVSPPGWAAFVLARRPEVPVFHVVRHPGGFLNSWATRFLATRVESEVRDANLTRLHVIAGLDDAWRRRFGAIDGMSAHEAELWYWSYVNEEISRAGDASERFTRVVFEDLVRDSAGTMQRLYDRLGVPFHDSVRRAVAASSDESPSISAKWRDRLTAEHQRLVERVLDESPLRSCWEDTP